MGLARYEEITPDLLDMPAGGSMVSLHKRHIASHGDPLPLYPKSLEQRKVLLRPPFDRGANINISS